MTGEDNMLLWQRPPQIQPGLLMFQKSLPIAQYTQLLVSVVKLGLDRVFCLILHHSIFSADLAGFSNLSGLF
jgi:hypothetical protein